MKDGKQKRKVAAAMAVLSKLGVSVDKLDVSNMYDGASYKERQNDSEFTPLIRAYRRILKLYLGVQYGNLNVEKSGKNVFLYGSFELPVVSADFYYFDPERYVNKETQKCMMFWPEFFEDKVRMNYVVDASLFTQKSKNIPVMCVNALHGASALQLLYINKPNWRMQDVVGDVIKEISLEKFLIAKGKVLADIAVNISKASNAKPAVTVKVITEFIKFFMSSEKRRMAYDKIPNAVYTTVINSLYVSNQEDKINKMIGV